MLPYLLIFSLSIGITYIGQNVIRRKRVLGITLFLLAIFSLSLFAAIRDYSVGADLLAHKSAYYDTAIQHNSISSYLSLFNHEYAFDAFTYITSHLFGSFRFLMFLFSFIPLSVLFYYGYKNSPNHMALFLAIYLALFFNTSLNVIRQSMAISLTIPAFFLMKKKRIFISLSLILMASLIHTSAVIMLVIYPLTILFSKQKRQLKNYLLIITLFAIFSSAIGLLSNNSLVASLGYAGYLKNDMTNLNVQFLLLKSCLLIFTTFFYKNYYSDEKCKIYYYFMLYDLLLYLFSGTVSYGYRLSYYFVVFYPFLLSSIADKATKKNKEILYIGLFILLILYWVDRNIIIGYDGTIPYLLGGDL